MTSEKCAILLSRVSTQFQDGDPQITDLVEYARSKGFSKFEKIETKETGLADLNDKIGLEKIQSFILSNPNFRTIFATEMSRIGRRQDILHQIKEWLITNRVQLILKDSGYSLFDENGKVSQAGELMFTFFGYFAENEMKTKKERFSRARKYLMEKGISISGPVLFGYQRERTENDKNILKIDIENSKVVMNIINWYLNGFEDKLHPSIKDICLKCIKEGYPKYTHSKRNVNKLLKEKGYTGLKVTNNKRKNSAYTENKNQEKYTISNNTIKYPPIIDDETYELVQNKLKDNNTNADKSNKHITILSNIIICEKCGNHFTGDYRMNKGNNKSNYRCGSRSKPIPCENKKSIGMTLLDSLVWSTIKSDIKLLAYSINQINPDLDYKNLEKNLVSIQNKCFELDNEISDMNKKIAILINSNSKNSIESLEVAVGKNDRLNYEREKYEKELNIIRRKIDIGKNRIENIDEVITNNIDKIESSKDLLKTYTNYFVKSIKILYQTNRYSLIEIMFKHESEDLPLVDESGKMRFSDGHIQGTTWLIVDKSITKNPQILKCTKMINILPNNKVKFVGLNITIDLSTILKLNINNPIYGLKPLTLTKLGDKPQSKK